MVLEWEGLNIWYFDKLSTWMVSELSGYIYGSLINVIQNGS
jgi:hypothetical protein